MILKTNTQWKNQNWLLLHDTSKIQILRVGEGIYKTGGLNYPGDKNLKTSVRLISFLVCFQRWKENQNQPERAKRFPLRVEAEKF